MRRFFVFSGLCLSCVGGPDAAAAQQHRSTTQSVNLPSQPLSTSLLKLARQYRIDILFTDEDLIGIWGHPVLGRLSVDQALRLLLDGANLEIRRTASGDYAVVAGRKPTALPATEPEILVIGRRTQNSDARRSESDIIPRTILTREMIGNSVMPTTETMLRAEIPANLLPATFAQSPVSALGLARSSVDLRGLGASSTLVLVDGRRMPGIPDLALTVSQPDINPIPPELLERVEVTTATAGGYYGPDAVAGVVNLVLARDYDGPSFAIDTGLSGKGDAFHRRLTGAYGWTSPSRRTSAMVATSASWTDGLSSGSRPYVEEALRTRNGLTQPPQSPSVNVASLDGSPLTLKDGRSLGSSITHLEAGADPAASAFSNAGSFDFRLSPDKNGAQRSLTSDQRGLFLNANIRHRFDRGWEIFVDYLDMESRGTADFQISPSPFFVMPDHPGNPFDEFVNVSVAMPDAWMRATTQARSQRLSVGLIAPLGGEWRGYVEHIRGLGRIDLRANGQGIGLDGLLALATGIAEPGKAALDPFGDPATFQTALADYLKPYTYRYRQTNHFNDSVLRIAGPLRLPAGKTANLSLSLEERGENIGDSLFTSDLILPTDTPLPGSHRRIRSALTELAIPLIGNANAPIFDVQAALRYDDSRMIVPVERTQPSTEPSARVSRDALVYTLGARFHPVRGLIFRASIASGELSPQPDDLVPLIWPGIALSFYSDPKRGGVPVGTEADYQVGTAGSPFATVRKARTISVGILLDLINRGGPSLSVDFSRLRRSGDTDPLDARDIEYILANEASFPNRVTRLPLSEADRAKGYSGGIVTFIDASAFQDSDTHVDSVDFRFLYPHRLNALTLSFRLFGTWQPRFERHTQAIAPLVTPVSGIIKGQVNGGVTVSADRWSVDLSGRWMSAFTLDDRINPPERVSGQISFDIMGQWQFGTLFGKLVKARLGMQNILDRAAPRVVQSAEGYNLYADPVGRRITMSLTAGF